MRAIFVSFLFAGLLCLSTTVVVAQSNVEAKKQVLNFEDELIEGRVGKPDLILLMQQKRINFKRLIKLRENFIPEVQSDERLWQGGKR